MKNITVLTDLSLPQLEEFVTSLGLPVYRSKQISRWIYKRLAVSFDEMTDLPQSLRNSLAERVRLQSLKALREVRSKDGSVKVLFAMDDGKTIESTYMPYPLTEGNYRSTICVSTQAGCPIGCPFCATGQQGFERNLTPGEIIEQVLFFARRLRDEGPLERLTNIVFMGMGEPLINYENLLPAIEMLNSPGGFGFGARNMTISTSGIVPQIQRLSKENMQVNLAVSLHASKNDLRDRLVPVNKRYPLEQLIPACREYIAATNRRISFEYTLFDRINDSLPQARSLAHLIAGLNCHVNLITANRTISEYRPSPLETVQAFARELLRLHIQYTVRHSRGVDIGAGCGQLRSRLK